MLRLYGAQRFDRARASMRASVQARLRALLDPPPAGDATLIATPRLSVKHTRCRRHVKVAFRARHLPRSGVPRDFQRTGRAFVVRTIGPRAWQLPMLVTMLVARFHIPNATAAGRSPLALRRHLQNLTRQRGGPTAHRSPGTRRPETSTIRPRREGWLPDRSSG